MKFASVMFVPLTLTVRLAGVNVNPAGLTAGTYSGTISVTSPSASGSISIPVSLTVTAVSAGISASPLSLTFQLAPGSAAQSQTIRLTSAGASRSYLAVVTSNGNWLSLRPANGATPATVTVTATPGTLGTGTYSGTVVIFDVATGTQQTVSVSLVVASGSSTGSRRFETRMDMKA